MPEDFFKDIFSEINEEQITKSLDKINNIIHKVAEQAKDDLEEHFNKNL